MKTATNPSPTLLLGTAMWGWTIPRKRCWQLLDQFYRDGFREVDTATNYPINKKPDDFRRAETILEEWIRINGIDDLKVMVKVGSLNNMRTPDHLLTRSFLWMNWEHYRRTLGANLDTIMIHWDNREDSAAIAESVAALAHIRDQGYRIGLSGIRYPELYQPPLAHYDLDVRIQIKHNLLHSDYPRYAPFHGHPRFITYGINAGGIKLSAEYTADNSLNVRGGAGRSHQRVAQQVNACFAKANQQERPPLDQFNQAGMIFAYYSPDIYGILTGPSRVEQWQQTRQFYERLEQGTYADVFEELNQIYATQR